MAITYKEGCLVEALASGEVEAIAHQANCQNTMNSGVAKAIRARYPQAYEADCATTKGDYDKLGSLSWTIVPTKHPAGAGMIFNLYGQFYYGREPGVVYTDLEALENSFQIMKLFLDASQAFTVGLPKLGAGLGGARWEDVEAIIARQLSEYEVTIYTK